MRVVRLLRPEGVKYEDVKTGFSRRKRGREGEGVIEVGEDEIFCGRRNIVDISHVDTVAECKSRAGDARTVGDLEGMEEKSRDVEGRGFGVKFEEKSRNVHVIGRLSLVHEIRKSFAKFRQVLLTDVNGEGSAALSDVGKVAEIVNTEKGVCVGVCQHYRVQMVHARLRERLQRTRPKVLATIYQNIPTWQRWRLF